jgi:hypothetical protein
MGGILELVEGLKSPVGILVLALIVGGVWYYLKWIKSDD